MKSLAIAYFIGQSLFYWEEEVNTFPNNRLIKTGEEA